MYIVQNQDGYFLTKAGEWADGREPGQLFKTRNKDEAANELFEANSHDFDLRLQLLLCETNTRGQILIADELLPPPLGIKLEEQPMAETTENQAIA